MSPVRRSAAAQATAWLVLLGLAFVAARGPMFAGPVPVSVAAVLAAAAAGLAATLMVGSTGLWRHGAFVAWPLLAPGVAATLATPSARMAILSLTPVVVALSVWWLRAATGMPRWPVVLTAATSLAAATADLLFRNPYRELRCHPLCVDNPWGPTERTGPVLGAGWILAGALVVALVRAAIALESDPPPWWRVTLAVVAAAVASAAVVDRLSRSARAPGGTAALRWTAVELMGVAVGASLALIPALQQLAARRRAMQWATEMEGAAAGGGVVEQLRRESADPTVRLATADHVDRAQDGTVTSITRRGVPVAVLEHRAESAERLLALLSSPVVAALENEVLLSTARRDLDTLRASRRAVVERSDAARRALQRDLHDGAQQRLIVLGLELSALAASAPPVQSGSIESAAQHAAAALDGLRRVAHLDLPPVLYDEGVAEALVSLAEQSTAPLELHLAAVEGRRFPTEVEVAAYRMIAASVDLASHAGTALTATVSVDDGPPIELVVRTEPASPLDDRIADDDRVGAAGGATRFVAMGDRTVYEARLPCE